MPQNLALDLGQQLVGLVVPSELLEEPGPLVEPLQGLVIRDDLVAQGLVALLTKSYLLAHQPMLLDERAHPHVGEPEVVPGYRGALLPSRGP